MLLLAGRKNYQTYKFQILTAFSKLIVMAYKCPGIPPRDEEYNKKIELIASKIDTYPDFPKPGVVFK